MALVLVSFFCQWACIAYGFLLMRRGNRMLIESGLWDYAAEDESDRVFGRGQMWCLGRVQRVHAHDAGLGVVLMAIFGHGRRRFGATDDETVTLADLTPEDLRPVDVRLFDGDVRLADFAPDAPWRDGNDG